MRNRLVVLALAAACAVSATSASAAPLHSGEPDYSVWAALLKTYYDPARGMDYAGLKAKEAVTLTKLRAQMSRVNAAALDPKARLAYWINLYNISVVGLVVDNYPVDSIRDISTDPIIRLNVFKKPTVLAGSEMISLDTIENDRIREAFHDPRVHFAINCAARSCPPIRTEPYTGARLDKQLDEQARLFLNGPHGARIERNGPAAVIHMTKIADWFGGDFENWGGGKAVFIRKYLDPDRAHLLEGATSIDFEYDDYDWDLNRR